MLLVKPVRLAKKRLIDTRKKSFFAKRSSSIVVNCFLREAASIGFLRVILNIICNTWVLLMN